MQVLWMRSTDEKDNVKYMFRIFGLGKHYAIWRKTRKTVLNYDPLWSILTALISPLLHAHCVKTGLLRGRGPCFHLFSFPAIIHCGQSLQGGKRERKKRRERERDKSLDWWMSHFFPYLSGFSIFAQKGLVFCGKFRGIVVNVHYSDGHTCPRYLTVVSYYTE